MILSKISQRSFYMRRRLGAIFLAFLMLLQLIPLGQINVAAATKGIILNFYYTREDHTYDDWSIWMWGDVLPGTDVKFSEVNDGTAKATIELDSGESKIGYIIRTSDWKKDVDKDQFIDISGIVSGTLDVYVTSGVEGEEIKEGTDVVKGVKVKKAVYNGDGTITITTFSATEEKFKVFLGDKEVAVKSQEATDDTTYVLTLEEELDTDSKYTLVCGEASYSISMPNVYSTKEFEDEYTYTGDDLGATWTKESTTFKLWAPTAKSVALNLYKSGTEGTDDLIKTVDMTADEKGTWVAKVDGDLNKTYYTYTVEVKGEKVEVCDPYARTTGVNGKRAMVIDLASTNPKGWENDKDPNASNKITDDVIYEAHVRDLTLESGTTNVGKFIGVGETGTTTEKGNKTGLDHIKDLGITHVQVLPFYDLGSVEETKEGGYNWGYDPVNYNVPEGSYSTDPYNGEVRVNEAKQMVKSLHDNGISVVMDVVYNHVYNASEFSFNKIVPGYFSRIDEDGKYSNGSGCGNDTATERSMVKKYIVDSVNYWADEYHIDGFRFDLVGLMDTETINEIVETVHKTHPNVIFYGEGWSMSTELTKSGYTLSTQVNSAETPGFAYFNDTIRDGLKGSIFDTGIGFVSGKEGQEQTMIDSFKGNVSWCNSPSQSINYASCHDNMTLFDRITASRDDASEADIIKMNNLAAAMYITSEGVPFMQAGEEILRSKVKEDGSFDSNSYNSGDAVNTIKWSNLDDEKYENVYNYYKGLIEFRKAHESLRLSTKAEVDKNVTELDGLDTNVVGLKVKEGSNDMYVIFNANTEVSEVEIPAGDWSVYVNGKKAGTTPIEKVEGTKLSVDPISALIVVGKEKTQTTKTLKATKIKKVENTSKGISVSWDKVSGASGYKLYKMTNDGSFKKVTTLKGTSYVDTKVKNGNMYTYKVVAYGNNVKSSTSKTAKTYRLISQKIKEISKKSNVLTIKFGKNVKASGYEIYYSTKSNFKNAKKVTVSTSKIKTSNITSKLKNVSMKKKYYVKIRSYKTTKSAKYYSGFSSVKAK